MRWIDVSSPLYDGMPTFPGDPPFSARRTHSLDLGDPYGASEIRIGSHTGTHVDPPIHFLRDGRSVDQIDLSVLNGPAQVIELDHAVSSVDPAALAALSGNVDRVLLKTANSSRWAASEEYFEEYVALTEDGAECLLAHGVRLVGIDALSIERDTTGRFPVHHRLLKGGAVIVEGLRLAGVPTGVVELRCLPLRIRGGDGAPARAMVGIPGDERPRREPR